MDNFDLITGRTWDGLTREEYWESIWRRRDVPVASPLSPTEADLVPSIMRASGDVLEALFPSIVWAGTAAVIASFAEPHKNN